MRVFLACTSLDAPYGGPARSVAGLAAALAKAGVEVALWSADGSSPASRSDEGYRLVRGELASLLRAAEAPHVIHDNGLWLPHNHAIATRSRDLRIPRVVSTRGMLEPWARRHKAIKKHLAWALYQRRDLRNAQCLHATSESEAENLERLGLGTEVRTIPNGVEVPDAAPDSARGGSKVALFLGRIYPIKGLPMLVRAWARVRPAGWKLRIAGPDEGGHRVIVEGEARAAGLAGVIEFTGAIGDQEKAALFSNADLFVLPSHSESFGIAAAEALAHGVPVLATRGTPWHALEQRKCGWWVETSEEGLASGLRDATSMDEAQRDAMGLRGREYVREQFAWPAVARQFIEIYRGLAADPKAIA